MSVFILPDVTLEPVACLSLSLSLSHSLSTFPISFVCCKAVWLFLSQVLFTEPSKSRKLVHLGEIQLQLFHILAHKHLLFVKFLEPLPKMYVHKQMFLFACVTSPFLKVPRWWCRCNGETKDFILPHSWLAGCVCVCVYYTWVAWLFFHCGLLTVRPSTVICFQVPPWPSILLCLVFPIL